MSKQTTDSDDYSGLGFDVEKHREAFKAFAALDLSPESIRPALIARNLVLYEGNNGPFIVGSTADAEAQERAARAQGVSAFKILYSSDNGEDVEQVRADVDKYFRRHFPGRCLEGIDGMGSGSHVYIAVYSPTERK